MVVKQMDAKVPLDVFEKVMNLASEGAKAVTQFLREVSLLLVEMRCPTFAVLNTCYSANKSHCFSCCDVFCSALLDREMESELLVHIEYFSLPSTLISLELM